jgi:hypothetical protein
MPEKNQIFSQKIKQKGFWNFTDLYNFCYMWLKDEGYNVSENEYTEKLVGNGKELVIKWEAKKKVSDYFLNMIEVKWRILGMQDAEVEKEGKKEKTNKGEVGFEITGTLLRDWEERWERNPSYKFFRGIYDKYIIKSTTEQYEDRLEAKCVSFVEQIKAFLQIEGKR